MSCDLGVSVCGPLALGCPYQAGLAPPFGIQNQKTIVSALAPHVMLSRVVYRQPAPRPVLGLYQRTCFLVQPPNPRTNSPNRPPPPHGLAAAAAAAAPRRMAEYEERYEGNGDPSAAITGGSSPTKPPGFSDEPDGPSQVRSLIRLIRVASSRLVGPWVMPRLYGE
jgi:hypothetical protein